MRSPRALHNNPACQASTAVTRCLRNQHALVRTTTDDGPVRVASASLANDG